MTEQEWISSTGPNAMLSFLQGKASDRQLRLFIANYCRRSWHLIPDERCRKAIEVAELSADGQVGDEELLRVYVEMWQIQSNSQGGTTPRIVADSCRRAVRPSGRITARIVGMAAENLARVVAEGSGGESERGAWGEASRAAWEAERRVVVDLLHDIFGNPFWPPAIDPVWLTCNEGTVKHLAKAAYEHRQLPSGDLDPGRLAVLCDALEDAGCPPDHELLLHLRGSGAHVRGCWAVDTVLARR